MTPPTSVEDVLERLDAIVAQARAENSRVAYFAVLYKLTTLAVKDSLVTRFEDPARAERFTSIFAGRYFAALDRFMRKEVTPLSWAESFRAASSWRPVVVQHLLLGMNAHINFDLGIAAVLAAPGAELPSLRADFELVNSIFGGLIERTQDALARITPSLRLIDALGGRTDEAVLEFSIRRARAAAWSAAERLAVLGPDAQQLELTRIDRVAQLLARKIQTPGVKLSLALLVVRAQEPRNVSTIIDQLEAAPEIRDYLNQVARSP
jgi:hypothetical protein